MTSTLTSSDIQRVAQHDNTVTIAKAIGILLMVAAHAGFYRQGDAFINMFHMPLFFFCSGYCFKVKYLNAPKDFIWRRVKGVYWPFVKWNLLFLSLHNVLYYLNIYNGEYGFQGRVSDLYSWMDFAKRGLNVLRMYDNEQLLGGFWFLHTLFYASFLAYVALKLCKRRLMGGLLLIMGGGLLLISLLLSATNLWIPFFGITCKEFMAAAIFVIGWYARSNGLKPQLLKPSTCLWVIGLLFVLVTVASVLMPMSMLSLKTWGVVPYFFVALCGIVMSFIVSSLLDEFLPKGWMRRLLLYIGEHTLDILTWHFLSFKLVSLLVIWVENRSIKELAYFPVIPADELSGSYFTPWWPLYLLAGTFVPLLATVRLSFFRKGFNRKWLQHVS